MSDEKGRCEWTPDDILPLWDTGCRETHAFIDGGPKENFHRFCPYCGKPIAVTVPNDG